MDRRPVATAPRVPRPEVREVSDSLRVATVRQPNRLSNMARRQLLVATGSRLHSPAVMGNRKAAVTGNRKAAVTDNRKVAVTGNRKLAVTGNRKAAVTGNRKAAVTGNRKLATAPQADSVPRKILLTACPVEPRWYRWAAGSEAPSARSGIRS